MPTVKLPHKRKLESEVEKENEAKEMISASKPGENIQNITEVGTAGNSSPKPLSVECSKSKNITVIEVTAIFGRRKLREQKTVVLNPPKVQFSEYGAACSGIKMSPFELEKAQGPKKLFQTAFDHLTSKYSSLVKPMFVSILSPYLWELLN